MGYYSNFSGDVTISGEGATEVEVNEEISYFCDLIEDEGSLVLHFGDHDSGKGYYFEDEILKLVSSNPELLFEGEIEVQGENPDDRWKLVFDGRKVTKWETEMVWVNEKVISK